MRLPNWRYPYDSSWTWPSLIISNLYMPILLATMVFSLPTEAAGIVEVTDCKSSILDLQIQLSGNVHFINLVSDNISSLLQSYPEQFPQQLKALIQLNTEIKVYIDQVEGIYMKIKETGVYTAEQAEVFKNIIRVLEEYLRSPLSDPRFVENLGTIHDSFVEMVEFNECLIRQEDEKWITWRTLIIDAIIFAIKSYFSR